MSEYLDKINVSLKEIEYVCDRLNSLQQSFHETGNIRLADTMNYLANVLDSTIQDIDQAVSQDIQEEFETAQQSTTNMIKACLAMSATKDDD